MIHIENVPHILRNGITHKTSPNSNPDFVSIGDVSLIDTRSHRQVRVDNGDPDGDSRLITLGDYIPFYFGIRMPMLYVIQNGGNFVERVTPPQDIIYIACSIKQIIDLDGEYYFSDGHATDGYTTFYDKRRISNLPDIIDWSSVKESYWGGQENLNIKRKKQAEFLVYEDIPADCIKGFVCYNSNAQDRLLEMGVEQNILVYPKAYY